MKRFILLLTLAILGALTKESSGQLIYNALVQTPGGGTASQLFQLQNGTVTSLNVGVANTLFPTPSRDGRFLTFSGVDPLRPNQASSDLFLFDRTTARTTTLIDNTALANRDGSVTSRQPLFSALSPNNQLVAVHTIVATISNNGGGTFEHLEMHRTDGQGVPALVEISTGQVANLHRAEFFGISWSPDGSRFVTSAAILLPSLNGQVTSLPGIVAYAFNPNVAPFGAWQRAANITRPTNTQGIDNFQIYPAFSPDGQRIAYFNVRASPLVNIPGIATLVVANANGSGSQALTSFEAGLFPGGLTWASDGSLLIFSIGRQASATIGLGVSQFASRVLPETTVVRAIDSVNGGTPFQLPNIDAGFSPSNTFSQQPIGGNGGGNGGGAPASLRDIPLRLINRGPAGLILQASGLDPDATYEFESSFTLNGFPNNQRFTGSRLMAGISIPNERQKFFRIRAFTP